MTNQIIDILLERPEKVERMVLLLLKTLITAWILNLIIIHVAPLCLTIDDKSVDLVSLAFLSKVSALKSAVYIVSFIVLWIMLWGILANLVLPIICKLFFWILQFFLILIPIIVLSLAIVGYRKVFKKPVKEKAVIDTEKTSGTQRLFNKLNDENRNRFFFGSLFIFHYMNTVSKSSIGSELLYEIMEHEKTDFYRSRILGYYTIVLILFISIGILKPDWINWAYYVVSVILAFLAILIAIMRDVLKDLDTSNLTDLRLILPNDMYVDMVDKTIEEHSISKQFKCESLRKRLVLSRIATKDETSCDFPRKVINVIRFTSDEEILTYTTFFKNFEKESPENAKYIVVTDMMPDVVVRNFLEKKGMYFIYAEDDEQLFLGLNKIRPLLRSWIDVKSEK